MQCLQKAQNESPSIENDVFLEKSAPENVNSWSGPDERSES
jgi:hypothetical protein